MAWFKLMYSDYGCKTCIISEVIIGNHRLTEVMANCYVCHQAESLQQLSMMSTQEAE